MEGKKTNGPEDTLGVDEEEAAKRDALLLDEHVVVSRDGHGLVGDQGQLQVRAKAALLAGLGRPREVGEVRVRRHACGWWRGRKYETRDRRARVGGKTNVPRTVVLICLNWGNASLKARISVGHTKVKSLQHTVDKGSVPSVPVA